MKKTVLSSKDIEEIINRYLQGESQTVLSENYHIDKRRVKSILEQNKVVIRDHSHKGRKYTINEHYFDIINTQNQAYILGLFFADGTNYPPQNRIRLELQQRDRAIVEKIKQELNSTHPIIYHELSKKNPAWQDSYALIFSNKVLSSRLCELGMVQNKSSYLKFPEYLSDELLPHFIRGYFDGDGHIEWGANKHGIITIASTKEFCEGLQKKLQELYGFKTSVYLTHNKESNTRILALMGKQQILQFLKIIYKDANLYIERKYSTYLNVLDDMENKQPLSA